MLLHHGWMGRIFHDRKLQVAFICDSMTVLARDVLVSLLVSTNGLPISIFRLAASTSHLSFNSIFFRHVITIANTFYPDSRHHTVSVRIHLYLGQEK